MSAACDTLVEDASAGVAASLRAVDCVSAEATNAAFSRLFGTHGALLPALSILLTLYIGFFALLLLTGRARLSISSLTPRMLTLGLVLTFTTSSVAYQGVVWNLAVGAPDQIAGILLGVKGSATQLFGDRIDILLNAIAEAAQSVQPGAPQTSQGNFTPTNLMWLSALMLLLGTVGVLVTARIALAILLGIGPVFITFLLFGGTRGLFAGWLRGVVLMASTPLLAVFGGASVIELAVPVVVTLQSPDGVNPRAAMALFVVAAVYCAMMILAIGVASTMVGAWRVFGLAGGGDKGASPGRDGAPAPSATSPYPATAYSPSRLRTLVSGASAGSLAAPASMLADSSAVRPALRGVVIPATASGGAVRPLKASRARGIGSRFSSQPTASRIF